MALPSSLAVIGGLGFSSGETQSMSSFTEKLSVTNEKKPNNHMQAQPKLVF